MAERDPCVVNAAPLAAALCRFVDDWYRERPPSSGGRFTAARTRQTVTYVGPLEWLAQETGLPRSTISTIKRGRFPRTAESIADSLVAALGHPEWMHDGTLQYEPNPTAPRDVRARCCGGSLTGSV